MRDLDHLRARPAVEAGAFVQILENQKSRACLSLIARTLRDCAIGDEP